uniref:Uncharacterized protein n=1 Tax=Oryza nivara TaxID=4536 RepID=A0A0E0GEJ6_ORYNI
MPDLPHPRNGTARTHHCTAGLAPRSPHAVAISAPAAEGSVGVAASGAAPSSPPQSGPLTVMHQAVAGRTGARQEPMAFGFKMLYEEGQGDFVILFFIDWPLVDIYELIYSIGTTKRSDGSKSKEDQKLKRHENKSFPLFECLDQLIGFTSSTSNHVNLKGKDMATTNNIAEERLVDGP